MAWTTSTPSARSSTQTSSLRTSCCVWVTRTSGAWLLRPQSGSNQGPHPHPAPQVPEPVWGWSWACGPPPLPESLFLSLPLRPCPSCPPVSNAPQEVWVSWAPLFSCPSSPHVLEAYLLSLPTLPSTPAAAFPKGWVAQMKGIHRVVSHVTQTACHWARQKGPPEGAQAAPGRGRHPVRGRPISSSPTLGFEE